MISRGDRLLSKEMLSQRFIHFAEKECKNSSHLYESLALKISEDSEILEMCQRARAGQPVPNLLFGAVHYLLLRGKEHELKEFYPSLVMDPKNNREAFPVFKDFCLQYKKEIIHLLQTKIVQTNEVRRCAYLYPVFSWIYERTKKPLSLIEIGTSAGIQLFWDQYAYSYNGKEVVGSVDSPVHITSQIIGKIKPFYLSTSPPVSTRIGIDLNIVDLTAIEDKWWMKALIWPEHRERFTLFEQAASLLTKDLPQLVEGDAIALLEEIVRQIPLDSSLCIFHTHVANQIPLEARKRLLNIVDQVGKKRDVFHIYNNIYDPYLHLDYYENGEEGRNTIAETDGHGRWVRWLEEL